MDDVRASKTLSLVLRHDPGSVGITLDGHGWVPIPDVLDGLERAGRAISREQLDRIVASSDKQRFAVDEQQDRIRANQGHSVQVDLELKPEVPPAALFHGTPVRNIAAIREHGLKKMARHAVHLSADRATAAKVGSRLGAFVVLEVFAAQLSRDGTEFFRSDNGVWLVDSVPPQYIRAAVNPSRNAVGRLSER
ncbi:MAG: RNA 2'-phosphotransferase [Nakamurella sp.]